MSNYVQTERLDQNRIRIISDLDLILFANEQVPVDRASLQQTVTISEIKSTIAALNAVQFFGDFEAAINQS